MIPSVLAEQFTQGVSDFLRTTFPSSTPFFAGALDALLQEEGAVFKGPYLSLQLPFRQGTGGPDFFPHLPMKFKPYLHQEKAFQRLTGSRPLSTIIATGTGSGKTECFLYPILDYCRAHREQEGVKALLIYPMNALATDQAGRIAMTIWNNPHLKGAVTAGLFIGQQTSNPQKAMSAAGIVTDRDTMHLKPPDILLTNYKMLDYLLIRPKDAPLWAYNSPETLRFLVVDELHTFDGAQGTDLACLLRRLKARLRTPIGHLCCVGTSATLGDGKDQDGLIRFSQEVFAEAFDDESIITESTLTAAEFIGDSSIEYVDAPSRGDASLLDPERFPGYADYLRAQYAFWFLEDIPGEDWEKSGWRIELGGRLKSSLFFRNLLASLDGSTRALPDILSDLSRWTPDFVTAGSPSQIRLLISFLALISEARTQGSGGGNGDENANPVGQEEYTRPFVNVRIQLWLRELKRMVAEVQDPPRMRFADDLTDEQRKTHLPMVHCRECGAMGWTGTKGMHDCIVDPDLKAFYQAFFKNSPKVVFLFPLSTHGASVVVDGEEFDLCASCLYLATPPKAGTRKHCPACGGDHFIRVMLPSSTEEKEGKIVGVHHCPFCGGRKSLTILGSQAASLTSVLVAQLYASNFNNDKKLLTFSDSVQDAAHRAGFVAARTYRFNFRTALQRFVQENGEGMSLADLPDAFCEYWSKRLGTNGFVATFLPPSLEWLPDYGYLKETGRLPDGSVLLRDVENRVGWEIFSEYGLYSRIGRTLEKTGSSIAHPDGKLLDEILPGLLEVLCNEDGGMWNLPERLLRTFVLGLLLRLRQRGGILHPVLGAYLDGKGHSTYVTKKLHPWMPGFGGSGRAPIFLTNAGGHAFDHISTGAGSKKVWLQDWTEKCFTLHNPFVIADPLSCVNRAIHALVAGRALGEVAVKHGKVWGILPEALAITTGVLHFQCDECGSEISIPETEENYWNGAPCVRFYCRGRYTRHDRGQEYYEKLYASGDVSRIFPAEHTGLLDREKRETLESHFKARGADRQPWYPNLLSCTPTLEMGIDIGDLSTVILCSVPPAQSNYIQRVGRSGRTDGNAVNMQLVNAKPHDLFFFSEPLEMIAGNIETPGVFLNAPAVLERQFTAYCFDRWVASGVGASAVPDQLGQVLNNLQTPDVPRFPYTFMSSITNNQDDLYQGFIGLFEGSLADDALTSLEVFIKGDHTTEGSLPWKILDGLHRRSRERDSLKAKVKILSRRIKKKMEDPAKGKDYESELDELNREKEGLQEILKKMRAQNTFNFFTDEGLIPNYAFPESGVTLRSIIYRRKSNPAAKGSKYDTWTEQYQRSAVSAIHELAPGSTFYAGARKVKVDQVDMSVTEPQPWRLCDQCAHATLWTADPETKTCPRCGSDAWLDVGRKRTMLRISQVFATSSDERSRISDDSDDREPAFFNKHMLVDFEDTAVARAYCIDTPEVAFGFDFITRASFREVNFGEDTSNGEPFLVAGYSVPANGFVVCKKCGKVQTGSGAIQHSWTCTARDLGSDANLIDCIHLFREFSTEAIRILMPVSTFSGSERKLQSFIAALQLGLKIYFKGKIDHLQTTLFEEPDPETDLRKKYLVIYDTVPGGTGYLKQLMGSERPLMEVLRNAFDVLSACACQNDPAKDGCYKCLFAYRTSYRMAETSRKTAIDLLGRILAQEDKIAPTDSLRKVPMDAILDSELEALFLEAIKAFNTDEMGVTISKELVNNKPGYILRVRKQDGGDEQVYSVEPQVHLGPNDGVSVNSSADFVFRSVQSRSSFPPIAVFLDGYEYHKNSMGRDMAKRMAIVQSGRFLTWSLTWADVESMIHKKGHHFVNFMDPGTMPMGGQLQPLLDSQGLEKFYKLHSQSSMEWLLKLLAEPGRIDDWRRYANVVGLTALELKGHEDKGGRDQWLTDLKKLTPSSLARLFEAVPEPYVWGSHVPSNAAFPGSLLLYGTRERTANKSPELLFACVLDDRDDHIGQKSFVPVWNGYLRLFNLFQLLPYAFFVTTSGVSANVYTAVIPEDDIFLGKPSFRSSTSDAWKELRQMLDPSCQVLVDVWSGLGWPVPEAGYELLDASGVVVSSAEIAWELEHVAILREDEMELASRFEERGWTVFALSGVLEDPQKISLGPTTQP